MSPEVLTHRITSELVKAVVTCPNEMSAQSIVLKIDPKQLGGSVMQQMTRRIAEAIVRLGEDGKLQLGE